MLFLSSVAHAAEPAAPGTSETLLSFAFPVFLLVVFYFVLIRPQQKRAKEQKALIDSLKVGDTVVTTGGMVGRIEKLGDNFADLKTGNTTITIQRNAIGNLMPKDALKDF